jgi:hypothetical protein
LDFGSRGDNKLLCLRDENARLPAVTDAALPDEEGSPAGTQTAIEALMLVADLGGPTMFARIGMMRGPDAR